MLAQQRARLNRVAKRLVAAKAALDRAMAEGKVQAAGRAARRSVRLGERLAAVQARLASTDASLRAVSATGSVNYRRLRPRRPLRARPLGGLGARVRVAPLVIAIRRLAYLPLFTPRHRTAAALRHRRRFGADAHPVHELVGGAVFQDGTQIAYNVDQGYTPLHAAYALQQATEPEDYYMGTVVAPHILALLARSDRGPEGVSPTALAFMSPAEAEDDLLTPYNIDAGDGISNLLEDEYGDYVDADFGARLNMQQRRCKRRGARIRKKVNRLQNRMSRAGVKRQGLMRKRVEKLRKRYERLQGKCPRLQSFGYDQYFFGILDEDTFASEVDELFGEFLDEMGLDVDDFGDDDLDDFGDDDLDDFGDDDLDDFGDDDLDDFGDDDLDDFGDDDLFGDDESEFGGPRRRRRPRRGRRGPGGRRRAAGPRLRKRRALARKHGKGGAKASSPKGRTAGEKVAGKAYKVARAAYVKSAKGGAQPAQLSVLAAAMKAAWAKLNSRQQGRRANRTPDKVFKRYPLPGGSSNALEVFGARMAAFPGGAGAPLLPPRLAGAEVYG